MRILSIRGLLILFSFMSFKCVLADEVYLKNGKAWINVKVLNEKSDQYSVVVFTSLGKTMSLKRSEIAGIKISKFEPRKESKLVEVGQDYIDYLSQNFQEPATDKVTITVNEKQLKKMLLDSLLKKFPKMRLNVCGGYGLRTARIPSNTDPQVKDYLNELKKGFLYEMSAVYFKHHYGVGVHFSRFYTSSSINHVVVYDQYGNRHIGMMSESITVSFLGVGVTNRYFLRNPNTLVVSTLAAGPIFFNDDASLLDIPMDIEGTTFGLHGLVGLEFVITDHFGFGGSISYLIGSLTKIKANGQEITLDQEESLKRVDFNLGFKYYFD